MKYFDYAYLKKDNSNFWEFYFEEGDILEETSIRAALYNWKGGPALFLDGDNMRDIAGTVWETDNEQVAAIKRKHYPEDTKLDTVITQSGHKVHTIVYIDPSVRRYDKLIETGSWSS